VKELNLKISISHLFSNLLNEETGNLLVLKKRCEWRGIGVEFNEVNSIEEFVQSDIYFLGSGAEAQLKEVAKTLDYYKEKLITERDNGAVFLGVGFGYNILGNSIKLDSANIINGLSLLDVDSEKMEKRFVGNVTAENDFLKPMTFVGFENHNMVSFLRNETKPLMTVAVGKGNNGKDKTEGARFKNVFGTNLHGPFLAINPHFADYLILSALEKRYGKKIELTKLDDDFEINAHNNLVNKVY